jgi:hypothetical protein
VLFFVLFSFAVMAVTSKDGWDRVIYGGFSVGTAVAIYYYRHNATVSGWAWVSGWF